MNYRPSQREQGTQSPSVFPPKDIAECFKSVFLKGNGSGVVTLKVAYETVDYFLRYYLIYLPGRLVLMMATGHLLYGYGNPVSRTRRVQSAGYPLSEEALMEIYNREERLPQLELDKIKANARQLWSYKQNQETTYDSSYCERPADQPASLRPSSPTRRNNPHPPQVFMTNRLHYIPGYHNVNTSLGREVYRVDASVPDDLREQRIEARQKYQGPYQGAIVSRSLHGYDPFGLKQQFKGRSAQGAEAWLKIADEKDHEKVFGAVHEDEENMRVQAARDSLNMAKESTRNRTFYPSVHRWMRRAGAREADAMARMGRSLDTEVDKGCDFPNPYHGRHVPLTPDNAVAEMRRRDIQAAAKVRFRCKPCRGDYLIDPEWPPCIPHHRVP